MRYKHLSAVAIVLVLLVALFSCGSPTSVGQVTQPSPTQTPQGAAPSPPAPTATWTLSPTDTAAPPSPTAEAEAPTQPPSPTAQPAVDSPTPLPTPTDTPLPTATPTASPSPVPVHTSPPNIILIVVDSLRADHVSGYGYPRQTTPNLDAFMVSQGAIFAEATTTSPWTCPSNAALMTGRMPSTVGATWGKIGDSLPAREETLAEHLSAAGYVTAGVASCYCTKGRLGFDQGFDHYDDVLSDRPGSNKARASEVNARAIDWLESRRYQRMASQPLFLFLYYFDPHLWYTPLPPYDTLYDPTYDGPLTGEVYKDGRDVVEGRIVPTARDVEHLLALYDGEITYWDAQIGQMLAYLQDNHFLDNAIVIVTADHGEMFGEHNAWTHGNTLYGEVVRIPLMVRYTGVIPPAMDETPVHNIDIMPTLLDWAGVPVPAAVQGTSLRSLLESQTPLPGHDVFSELDGITDPSSQFYWLAPRVDLRSIQRQNWKLIHHVGDINADELYELHSSSPYETENLLSVEPDLANQLRIDLQRWFGLQPQGMSCYIPVML